MSHPVLAGLPPSARLLLIVARVDLTPAQADALRALCGQIDDWGTVVREARFRMISELLRHHLLAHAADLVPEGALRRLELIAQRSIERSLSVRAELHRLTTRLFEPLGISPVVFKGPALALRYYEQPALRSCRDLDLLLERSEWESLFGALLDEGYRVLDEEDAPQTPGEVQFAAHFRPPPALKSPHGVIVEFSTALEKRGRRFPTAEMLQIAEPFEREGTRLRALPLATLFPYLCLHHTRHGWARLHWLADLDAVVRHADFNRAKVLAEARSRGLASTVEAALDLHEIAGDVHLDARRRVTAPAADLTRDLATMLQANRAAEVALTEPRARRRDAHVWQSSALQRVLEWSLQWLRPPRLDDYRRWPLPPRLFWLYRLLQPLGLLLRRV